MPSQLGARLRTLINESGMQQQQVASKLGIKVPTFNGYVIGKREPNLEKMVKFAEYFDVSIDYLLGRTEYREMYKGNNIEYDLNPINEISNTTDKKTG